MQVISLKDYAAQNNVSYEAVRQQVARYKADLDGHIIRDGRQQFLDEEAVAFLDGKRQKNPVVIYEQSKDEAIERMRVERELLRDKIAAQADKIAALADWKAENAQLIAAAAQSRLALQAAEDEKILLQQDLAAANQEIADLRQSDLQNQERAAAAEEREQAAIREMEDLRQSDLQSQERAAAAEAAAAEANAQAEQIRKEWEEYKALPWYKRIFR
jgi:hypothetical protein